MQFTDINVQLLQTDPNLLKYYYIYRSQSTMPPGLNIGSGAIVGEGAAVTKNISAEITVLGNPSHGLKNRNQ